MARLSFLGAARTVTGSQYLVENGSHRIMVDCGMFQGSKELRLRNWSDPTPEPDTVSALILTHTHLDHIGRVPRLVKRGFSGPIYCTPPTRELAEEILGDAAHLQQEDADYFNRKGLTKHKPALPLFDATDVQRCLEQFRTVEVDTDQDLGPGARFRYQHAGHLLGAVSVLLSLEADGKPTRLVFSGDVGRYDAVLAKVPMPAPPADYVVIESTYGNRHHAAVPLLEQLEAVLARTFARGGVLLIPAFAVGRAQQLIYLMHQLITEGRLRPFPIHLDSPMAIDATRIYASYPEGHRVSLAGVGGRSVLYDKWLQLHRTRDESKRLNDVKGPAVIISASGMLSGGRILHHCRVRLPKPENTLLITGYQAATTLGRALLDGRRVVRIHKGEVPVLAEVASLKGISAHADADELMRWLSGAEAPRRVFVTHGEEASALALADRIRRERGLETHVPKLGERVALQG